MRRWVIVLIAPKEPGNIGAAARVLKNFGAGGLRVVAPRCEVNGEDARRFSSGAAEILRSAPVFPTLAEAIADRELTIGLSGVCGKHHRVDCTGLVPQAVVERYPLTAKGALIFGREDAGMEGEEMDLCHFLWSLPTNPAFPSLNLAQAIGITLAGVAEAERILAGREYGQGIAPSPRALNPLAGRADEQDDLATSEQLHALLDHFRRLMARTGWVEEARVTLSLGRLRNLFARAGMTLRDANLLHGVCHQALVHLNRQEGGTAPPPPSVPPGDGA